jgi:hypothetical protein
MKKLVIYLLAMCLIGVSCEEGQPMVEKFPQKISPILIAQGELYGNSRDSITEQNIVITTQEEWSNLIDAMRLENSSVTNIAETDIDFTQYQVIAVFGKVEGNGGWSIAITNIMEYSDSIVATYTNIETGNLVDAIAQPFQIVKIPLSNKKVAFDSGGEVLYKICPCENPLEKDYLRGEAYLFRDSIPAQMYHQIRAENPKPDIIRWIIFNSETGVTNLIIEDFPLFLDENLDVGYRNGRPPNASDRLSCMICNFPDFAKEWTVSYNGCKVYIEGIPHLTCGSIHLGFYLDYSLTRLKRR